MAVATIGHLNLSEHQHDFPYCFALQLVSLAGLKCHFMGTNPYTIGATAANSGCVQSPNRSDARHRLV